MCSDFELKEGKFILEMQCSRWDPTKTQCLGPQEWLSWMTSLSHVPEHSFWEDLLHDLIRHKGEVDKLVVPNVLLSTLFEDGNFSLFPITWIFT